MTFQAPFLPPVSKPFPANTAAAAAWYLSGGVSLSDILAVYQPKGAASTAASYINLANPGTNNAALGVAPDWDAVNGWIFTKASSQYLLTGIATNLARTLIIRFSGLASNINGIIGTYPNGLGLWPSFTDNVAYYDSGSEISAGANSGYSSGIAAVSGTIGYKNGSSHVTGLTGVITRTTIIPIGTLWEQNSYTLNCATVNIQAVFIGSTVLLPAQVLAISTAMAAL